MASTAPRILPSLFRRAAASAKLQTRTIHTFPRTTPISRSTNRSFPAFQKRSVGGAPRGGELPTGSGKSPFPVIPLVVLFFAGSGAFLYMVDSRKETMPVVPYNNVKRDGPPGSNPLAADKQIAPPKQSKPAFSPAEASVIFVLGGPGAGKGTQCANLVRDYGFVHLSAGDLLRAEQNREGSEFGELIKTYIREGKIVPMEVTVALLENAMREAMTTQGKSKFLIDGFPRKMDQAIKFEEAVCESSFTLFFDCPEEVMLKRLLKRGETSGREDDNIESIKKRFRTFVETSYPVVDYFGKQGKVVNVKATDTPENVYAQVQKELKGKLNF